MGGLRGDVVVNNSSDSLKSIHDQLALLHSEIAEIRLDSKQEVNGLRTEIKGQVAVYAPEIIFVKRDKDLLVSAFSHFYER